MKKPNSNTKPPENRALNLLAASVELEAAPADGEPQKLRRFTMTAYTGGAMQLAGWRYPVVVDLQGLQLGKQRRPILLDHTRDVDFVMGQTDSIAVMNDQLVVAGQVMGDSPKARQVIALNDKGFGWQASIGARADQVEFVPEGKTSQANGRDFPGPVNIARRATLGEISFVVLGADENTSAQIAASADQSKETADMDFTKWLESQGFTVDALSEQQTKNLRAIYDAQAAKPTGDPEPSPAATIRAEAAAEAKRIAAVRKICGGKHGEIEAKAIEEGWDTTRTELEVLRASRPQGPAIQAGGKAPSAQAIEAALCLSVRMSEEKVLRWYGQQTVEAAQSRDLRGMGLHELLYQVIHAAGGHARPGRMNDDTIRTAFEADRTLRAAGGGFSTISLSGILSNVANKALLEAYTAVESVAVRICAQADVNDFKQVTRYRMTGQGSYLVPLRAGQTQELPRNAESQWPRLFSFLAFFRGFPRSWPYPQQSLVRPRAFGVRVHPPGLRSHAETLLPKLSDSRVTIPRKVTITLTLAVTNSVVRAEREDGPPALAVIGRCNWLAIDTEERLQVAGQKLPPLLVLAAGIRAFPGQHAVAPGQCLEQFPLLRRSGVAAVGHAYLGVVVRATSGPDPNP